MARRLELKETTTVEDVAAAILRHFSRLPRDRHCTALEVARGLTGGPIPGPKAMAAVAQALEDLRLAKHLNRYIIQAGGWSVTTYVLRDRQRFG